MNKSPKTLLFVTYQYPYLPGEYFIESEIEHLADAFDRVYIFPYRRLWWNDGKEPRALPEGVELLDPQLASRGLRFVWNLLGLLLAPLRMYRAAAGWPGGAVPSGRLLKSLRDSMKTLVVKWALLWFAKHQLDSASRINGYAYWRDPGAGGLALVRERLRMHRLYVRAHRVDIYSAFRWPVETPIHLHADKVFTVSEDGRNYLVNTKGLPQDKIEVQRLGVRLPSVCAKASDDGVIRILSCSNLVPVKRMPLIAEVVAALPGRVEWSHIGDGPGLPLLKEQIKKLGIEDRVQFVGRLSNLEVYEYFQDHPVDVFINLSESEGVPVSIMEALAHGVPCVATDVGGSAEIVNEQNGAIVDVECEPGEVATILSRVVSDRSARVAAREMADSMCSSDRNYSEFCKLFCD